MFTPLRFHSGIPKPGDMYVTCVFHKNNWNNMLGRRGLLPEPQGRFDELQHVIHEVVGNCLHQNCTFCCSGQPIFIIVSMIFILWIVSRCAFHNASSQLIFISKIDVGPHLQGIAQVFRPEFRYFLSEPSHQVVSTYAFLGCMSKYL